MASYEVRLTRSARKELGGSVKLATSDSTYRIRVGNYRVIYEVLDRLLVVDVIRIGHRREVYR